MTSIVLISESVGFPYGMAATQRLKLFAKMLVEQGFTVTILCLRVEKPTNLENNLVSGSWNGVNFEYTTGTTIRPQNFLSRRWVEFRGVVVGIYRLIQLKSQNKVDAIFSLIGLHNLSHYHFIFVLLSRLLNIPYVLEVCERPWVQNEKTIPPLRKIPSLSGVQGVICISDYLMKWCESENAKFNLNVEILKIPIMYDKSEFSGAHTRPSEPAAQSYPVLLFASSAYFQAAKFTINAMRFVWNEFPEAKLVITGLDPENAQTKLLENDIINDKHKDQIEFTGYIPREELINRYSQANGLLIPLSNDIISKARFPTKIGEYLKSERPIITSNVGEIPQYFTHRENALISEPDNARAFAENIIFVIRHPEQANDIGKNGSRLADEHFDYQKYGSILKDYFLMIIGNSSKSK
jgi:glycosyltransferase involved in cell wall biosynthesis